MAGAGAEVVTGVQLYPSDPLIQPVSGSVTITVPLVVPSEKPSTAWNTIPSLLTVRVAGLTTADVTLVLSRLP